MVIFLSMWPLRRRPNTTGSRTAPKPFLVDSQWVLIKDLLHDPTKIEAWRASTSCGQSVLGRHALDSTDRRSIARFTRTMPQSFNLLAAIAGVDRNKRLVKSVATVAEETRCAQPD